jgi:hypothetical protein
MSPFRGHDTAVYIESLPSPSPYKAWVSPPLSTSDTLSRPNVAMAPFRGHDIAVYIESLPSPSPCKAWVTPP